MYLLYTFENGSSAIPLTEMQNLSDHLQNICFATLLQLICKIFSKAWSIVGTVIILVFNIFQIDIPANISAEIRIMIDVEVRRSIIYLTLLSVQRSIITHYNNYK